MMGDLVVDIHAHLWSVAYLDLLAAAGVTDLEMYRHLAASDSQEDLDTRFALMDMAGIDVQVLSATPLVPHLEDREAAIATAAHVNDEYASLVDRFPTRLRAFLSLPLPHVADAVAALDRLDDERFVGVALTTDILGTPLTDPRFDDLFAALDRRGAVVLVHPVGADARSPLIAARPMRWAVGAPIEDTIAMADLLLAGHLSRFPEVRIVSTHLGGALPMLLPRMQAQQPWEAPDAPESPLTAARRAWFDTVTHVNPAALRAASDVLGSDHLLLGTDYPFQAQDELPADVALLDTVLAPAAAVAVRSRNATSLFSRTPWIITGGAA
ncbi:aminocarboxymuconate-semialdehyde decarboxylase [Microbacterium resistens]|uniref:Aminocarboxymuconate-semialdehyde decarboxylase n=1 Tax=Microbacterium resistens TaxID=156977 RepID=A0ABU1S905_9MICO|nr:amidohydrolase family protein [Microbacterium resistens]MDR6866096.1 aminocarboxymuconate-semialdehyde decarboxylase [Microbacterium resistens]